MIVKQKNTPIHRWSWVTDDQTMGWLDIQVAGDQADIIHIETVEVMRQKGIAKALLIEAIHDLAILGVHTLFLEVRISHNAAIRLYQQCGFVVTGQRKNYYPHPTHEHEDALVMKKNLNGEVPQ